MAFLVSPSLLSKIHVHLVPHLQLILITITITVGDMSNMHKIV